MRLAIADPPYPPTFGVRYDTAAGDPRITVRSRATRWYGAGPRGATDSAPADFHPDAGRWDDLDEHRKLLAHLVAEYDGWALATTPDGLGAYHPLPIGANVLAWVNPRGMPGGARLQQRWEAVIVSIPVARRPRSAGQRVSTVLVEASPRIGFAGAKPTGWTKWVLDVLGYDPATDTVDDLFPGSGSVSNAIGQQALA